MTTVDKEGILRDVLTNPSDNTPRLIYADWLEEYGNEYDVARAEFIRLQIDSSILRKVPDVLSNVLLEKLLYKSDELLLKYKLLWNRACWPLNTAAWDNAIKTEWSRGFISKVSLNLKDFLQFGIAENLFSSHPIEQLKLIDIVPRDELKYGPALYCAKSLKWCKDREDIPLVLEELLPKSYHHYFSGWKFFHTTEIANEALSIACVRYGRKEASLPYDT